MLFRSVFATDHYLSIFILSLENTFITDKAMKTSLFINLNIWLMSTVKIVHIKD